MYKINYGKYIDVLNWNCIYCGIKNDIIEPADAILYVEELIKVNPQIDNPLIIELLIADTKDKDTILSFINKIICSDKSLNNNEKHSLRILRYVILIEFQRNIKDVHKLLEKIEAVYADFNYPSDMENFISYMPCKNNENYDVSEHTYKENINHIIENFNIFLENEHKSLNIKL